jgi:hypothetical protein
VLTAGVRGCGRIRRADAFAQFMSIRTHISMFAPEFNSNRSFRHDMFSICRRVGRPHSVLHHCLVGAFVGSSGEWIWARGRIAKSGEFTEQPRLSHSPIA